MRTVIVPKTVKIKSQGQIAEISFYQWLDEFVLNDPKFGKKASEVLIANKISRKFIESNYEDEVLLDEAVWSLLANVVEEPSNGYNPEIARQLSNYILAILEAKED